MPIAHVIFADSTTVSPTVRVAVFDGFKELIGQVHSLSMADNGSANPCYVAAYFASACISRSDYPVLIANTQEARSVGAVQSLLTNPGNWPKNHKGPQGLPPGSEAGIFWVEKNTKGAGARVLVWGGTGFDGMSPFPKGIPQEVIVQESRDESDDREGDG